MEKVFNSHFIENYRIPNWTNLTKVTQLVGDIAASGSQVPGDHSLFHDEQEKDVQHMWKGSDGSGYIRQGLITFWAQSPPN